MGFTAAASIAASVAAAGISAISAEKQGEMQANAADYQAAVARNNQILANQSAQQAIAQGGVDAGQAQQKAAQQLSLVRAKEAASGVTLDSGSALDVQSDTAKSGALDALTIRNDAARKAYGFEVQGAQLGSQAQFDVVQGENDQQLADLKAADSLLSGASSSANQGMRFAGYFG